MNQRFLAIGECMVEMAPQTSGDYTLNFAGDTFNTAWYLRQLAPVELEVAYLTGVGDDAMSERMTDFMRASGVVPEVLTVADRTVGLYLISLQNGERSFQYWRNASAARSLAENLAPVESLKKGDMAYFSGITLAILADEDKTKLLSTLANARESGVTVVFDTNLRPRLWETLDQMRHWIMQAASVADIALPSFDDETEFFVDADKQATKTRYEQCGVKHVIVKDGPKTVLFRDESGSDTEFAPTVNSAPVDSTAAGDAFNAGFLANFLKGDKLIKAVEAGCTLSHEVVSHKGALVNIRR